MCGIVGYIGNKDAYPILINGLRRLEYRGYDSAGVALYQNQQIGLYKCKGKVADLESVANGNDLEGTLGIAHTRWATHGEPNDVNSHPHVSNSGELVLIHNGIIENYASLKEALQNRGFSFQSETDTEVLVNLIEDVKNTENIDLENAVRLALNQVVGAYAIAIFSRNNPQQIVLAKMGSPLVVGLGENEYFVASDATPFLEYTKKAVYLEDGEMAVVDLEHGFKVARIRDNKAVDPYVQQLKLDLAAIEKSGYDHFMLKEIYEQPKAIEDTYRGRLLPDQNLIKLGGFEEYKSAFVNADRILIVACGTSWHAGLVGEYLFEDLARVPVEVEYASEFRYRNPSLLIVM
jgi:glucosamine--fructose-6-phosphate aminotransferase (isomerizing)